MFFIADFVNTSILIDLESLPSHPLEKEQDSVLGKFRCHKIPLYTIHKVNPDLAINFLEIHGEHPFEGFLLTIIHVDFLLR